MPRDVTERIPLPLSSRVVGGGSTTSTTQWDVSIDGYGFLLSGDPYQRQTAPVQKQQIDTSAEAGEQTLDDGWIRSQTSWHCGAGADYYEPAVKDPLMLPSRYRFSGSAGVDVWTPGQLTLLKSTVLTGGVPASDVWVTGAKIGGGHYWFRSVPGGVTRYGEAGGASTVAVTDGASPVVVAGTTGLVGHSFGIDAGPLSAGSWARLYNKSIGVAVRPWWAKGRIVAAVGPELHELTLSGSSGSGTIGAGTVLYTHPDAGWVWTAVAETGSAILAAGHGGGNGSIFRFALKDAASGSVPVLSQAYEVAALPPGEEILSVVVYLGKYVGIGTSRGVRVGVVSDAGELQYGPLLCEPGPVSALAARGSFLYAAGASVAGVPFTLRVSLSSSIDDGLTFPWAYDVQPGGSGSPSSICFIGHTDRVVVAVPGAGAYVQSETVYESAGFVTSGAIRYGTSVSKLFQSIDLRALTASGGSVSVSVSDPAGVAVPVATLAGGADGSALSLERVPGTHESLTYRVDLTAAGVVSPVVQSVAVRAVPAVPRRRLIRLPLLVSDAVTDRVGGRHGHVGAGWESLSVLEGLEGSGAVVTVTDYRTGETVRATVEEVSFKGVAAPSGGGSKGRNFGGVAEVTVKTL